MKKRYSAVAKSFLAACLAALLVMSTGCRSDKPGEQEAERETKQPPKAQPTFTEASKATLTFKGKTLEFRSAVGILSRGAKRLAVHFFPYELTNAQKAALLKGDTPGLVNADAKGHDPQNWPHKPTFAVNIRFKDDSKSHTTEDISQCSLSIRGWVNDSSTHGVPLESTIETLKLGALQTGGQLSLTGTAKGRFDEKTTVTFEAKTVVIAAAD